MPRKTLSTSEAYGPERLPIEVPYPVELSGMLKGLLRKQRQRTEARAKRLIWADERAAQARSHAAGTSGARRPTGEERSTRGIVLEKPEADGQDILIGWVDAAYRNTRTEVRVDVYERRRKRTVHGGTKFASITIGHAHAERRSKQDVSVAVPGHGLLWATIGEVVSTRSEYVQRAFAGGRLTDKVYAAAKQGLDRLDGALDLLNESMRDPGLNPEIANYLGVSGDSLG